MVAICGNMYMFTKTRGHDGSLLQNAPVQGKATGRPVRMITEGVMITAPGNAAFKVQFIISGIASMRSLLTQPPLVETRGALGTVRVIVFACGHTILSAI